jgi:hypothetical protein
MSDLSLLKLQKWASVWCMARTYANMVKMACRAGNRGTTINVGVSSNRISIGTFPYISVFLSNYP